MEDRWYIGLWDIIFEITYSLIHLITRRGSADKSNVQYHNTMVRFPKSLLFQ